MGSDTYYLEVTFYGGPNEHMTIDADDVLSGGITGFENDNDGAMHIWIGGMLRKTIRDASTVRGVRIYPMSKGQLLSEG